MKVQLGSFFVVLVLAASAQAEPAPGGVVSPPRMPVESQMVIPAPHVGDGSIVGRPTPVGESQDEFVDRMIARLQEESTAIKDLRARISDLTPAERKLAMPSLRTASGNRVVALSKLEGLAEANALTWSERKPAVERAFQDLRAAIERTRGALAH